MLLGTWRELRRLERSAAGPWDDVRAMQLDRLVRMVQHARRTIPLYRGLQPVHSLDDLGSLPVIGREVIQAVPIPDRRSSATGDVPVISHSSSGSTGHAVTTELTHGSSWWRGVLWMRRRRSQGLQPWSRHLTLRAAAESNDRVSPLWRLTGRRISTMDPVTTSIGDQLRLIQRARPDVLVGKPHVLSEIAAAAPAGLTLRAVVSGGATLTPEDRATIERGLGAAPFDVYGMVEQGPVAGQCRASDLYHVDHESVIVEVLDDDGRPAAPGESGHLVTTGLWNPHMPYLRYRTGDRATLADRPCRCGHALPALASIDGRDLDRLVAGDGSTRAAERLFMSAVLPAETGTAMIRRYQVRQGTDGACTVSILVTADARREEVADLLHRVEQAYGSVLCRPVAARTVTDLPLERTGKFKQVVSELGG
ncbi:MAG TPA: hypothetical protein DCS55_02670 [Acidimicrobiaceae bacterium]|nr:hypothetical protein [Acidimicrobiaceae bacterium]